MSDIKDKLNELIRIEEKLKELRGKLKRYTDRKNELMTMIGVYMKNNNHAGIKCKELGYTILAESGIKMKRKTKNQQKEDLRQSLLDRGIRLGDDDLEELVKTLKGNEEEQVKIRIKKLIK